MFRLICLCLVAITLLSGQALANNLADARSQFLSGDYDTAIELALSAQTPEGFMLAAETLSAKVMLGYVDDANDSAKQARKWAEKAVEALPNSQEAHIQFALAYGFETRTSSPFRAWRKNLPKKTLEAIEDCRVKYPDDPRGDALLGAWHLGIARKAGAKRAMDWYNASAEDGIRYYEAALQAAPDDIVIAGNYAVTLLGLDTDQYTDRAAEIMTAIANMPDRNAVEAEVKDRIAELYRLKDDPEALKQAVSLMLDGE